jgi:hypothetical protein
VTVRSPWLPALVAGAAVVLVAVQAVPGEPGRDSYTNEVAAVCSVTFDRLETFSGTYWEALRFISVNKLNALRKIHPPPERQRLHRDLLARESRLQRGAEVGRPFQTLRAEQAALDSRYRSIGIRNCSR